MSDRFVFAPPAKWPASLLRVDAGKVPDAKWIGADVDSRLTPVLLPTSMDRMFLRDARGLHQWFIGQVQDKLGTSSSLLCYAIPCRVPTDDSPEPEGALELLAGKTPTEAATSYPTLQLSVLPYLAGKRAETAAEVEPNGKQVEP